MEVVPVDGLPEIQPGDDLGALVEERADLAPDDILAIASTVVSKAEGRAADLDAFEPGRRARQLTRRLADLTGTERDPRFVQAVLEESSAVVMEAPFLLTETRFGHVGVNAGIDRSNTGGADLLLLPRSPAASARRIRGALSHRNPVVVTDTCGRPFRRGQVGIAIGWAGLPPHRDWRGTTDREGRDLTVTVECIVDEIAAAANLVTGEGDGGTPAVVVRDLAVPSGDEDDRLFRDLASDYVRAALREWSYDSMRPENAQDRSQRQ